MNERNGLLQDRTEERRLSLIHGFLVTAMLTLFAFSITQVGEYVVPSWDGTYLVVISALIAVEAQYSYRLFAKQGFTKEQALYRLSEWVVIIILLKVLNYGLRGFDILAADLVLWQDNFIYSFFSGEYLISLLFTAVVWGLATFFSAKLFQLEGDEELLNLERESSVAVHRKEVREGLAFGILFVGIIMVGTVAFIFLTRRTSTFGTADVPSGIVPVVFYFAFGLALLSITQFSILRVHWMMDRIPFKPNLISQWLLYSLGLLLLVGIVSILLPTSYSVGLLEFLNTLLAMLLWGLWVIAFLLTLPIALLLSLLLRFRGGEEGPPPSMEQFLPDPPQQAGPPAGWVEWLKTLLFWAFFLGIVIFSLVYFLRQNRQLMEKLRRFKIYETLKNILQKIKTFFVGANENFRAAVQKQVERIRARRLNQSERRLGFINPRRLESRRQVYYYYLAMVRRGNESGLPRKPDQTPDEYLKYLSTRLVDDDQSAAQLTVNFKEARYSQHQISDDRARRSQSAWDTIKRKLREYSRQKNAL